MKNVKEILEEYLKANGFDGLAGDECGCFIGDLVPCDNDPSGCVPGHKIVCTAEMAYKCDRACWCKEGESCIKS